MRIIAATNRDLAALVAEGAFREDLFYRVNVVKLDLPPLRERKEDIPLLVEHFVARFNRRQGKRVAGVAADVMALLMAHDYPGNVRELENIIEQAFVLCAEAAGSSASTCRPNSGHAAAPGRAGRRHRSARRAAAEAQAIRAALERYGVQPPRRRPRARPAQEHALPQDGRLGIDVPRTARPDGRSRTKARHRD